MAWLIRWTMLICLAVTFSGCGELQDRMALDDFKKSSEATDIAKCVGANGNIDWKIFKPTDKNNNVRVIQADMHKGDENFTIQYYYNIETKVSEIAFLSNDGKPKSRLIGGMELGLFCM